MSSGSVGRPGEKEPLPLPDEKNKKKDTKLEEQVGRVAHEAIGSRDRAGAVSQPSEWKQKKGINTGTIKHIIEHEKQNLSKSIKEFFNSFFKFDPERLDIMSDLVSSFFIDRLSIILNASHSDPSGKILDQLTQKPHVDDLKDMLSVHGFTDDQIKIIKHNLTLLNDDVLLPIVDRAKEKIKELDPGVVLNNFKQWVLDAVQDKNVKNSLQGSISRETGITQYVPNLPQAIGEFMEQSLPRIIMKNPSLNSEQILAKFREKPIQERFEGLLKELCAGDQTFLPSNPILLKFYRENKYFGELVSSVIEEVLKKSEKIRTLLGTESRKAPVKASRESKVPELAIHKPVTGMTPSKSSGPSVYNLTVNEAVSKALKERKVSDDIKKKFGEELIKKDFSMEFIMQFIEDKIGSSIAKAIKSSKEAESINVDLDELKERLLDSEELSKIANAIVVEEGHTGSFMPLIQEKVEMILKNLPLKQIIKDVLLKVKRLKIA